MKNLMCLGLVALVVASACGKKDETPPPAAGGVQGANGQYPNNGQPTGYPNNGQPTPVTPAAPQLATPGPLALPCTADSACGLAHCNTQYSKCAFPCVANTDCIQGNSCNAQTGFCLPGGG